MPRKVDAARSDRYKEITEKIGTLAEGKGLAPEMVESMLRDEWLADSPRHRRGFQP